MQGISESAHAFGQEIFGQAGWHAATAARWTRIAAGLLRHPAPFVTAAFRDEAEQTAVFRQLRSSNLTVDDVVTAVSDATARKAAAESVVIVPIDGSSIAIRDVDGRKGAGLQSTRSMIAWGFKVMTAIAVTITGVPIGVAGLFWWTRPRSIPKRTADEKNRRRKSKTVMEKESGHWFRLLDAIVARMSAFAPTCTPWFQMDRGADIAELLHHITQRKLLATIRLAHERRDVSAAHRTQLQSVRRARSLGEYALEIPSGRKRAQRQARMSVRACEVAIRIPRTKLTVTINVVHTREVRTTPHDEAPLEWFLYTTAPIRTLDQCTSVIDAYAMRWSIESFHNAWKSGGTRVEQTQLRSETAILKWATVLAAVSLRAIRLAKLGRETPDVPATTEFNKHEIEATILLRKPKGIRIGHVPNMAQMVRWVADLGGYAGSRARTPPGKTVILRGLLDVEAAARALEQRDKMNN